MNMLVLSEVEGCCVELITLVNTPRGAGRHDVYLDFYGIFFYVILNDYKAGSVSVW